MSDTPSTATKIAQCCCGALRAEVQGEPQGGVVICHCADCQRRTGATFGVGAYYSKKKVNISGESRVYTRAGASGHALHQQFCPTCGTNLFWYPTFRPEVIGIAVGGFVDPNFPPPVRSVWEQTRHAWVELPEGTSHFAQGQKRGPTE